MDGQFRIEVDQDDCIGCGLCEERAPENLEIEREEGAAQVVAQPATEEQVTACREAADYCPIGALSVEGPDAVAPEEKQRVPARGSGCSGALVTTAVSTAMERKDR